MVRRQVVGEVGPLGERFFMYSEEEDWCFRMKQRGWKVVYVPEAVIIHYQGMSTRQRSTEMLMELYRSKLKFFRKNYGRRRGWLLRGALILLTGMRISFYTLLSRFREGEREEAGNSREESLMILRAMLSRRRKQEAEGCSTSIPDRLPTSS